jgi:Flp pilus assembly protein protease CpaA
MNEYIFLFGLAFIFTLVASIQDLKKREVANWLNFSIIAFALAYRAFYAVQTKNADFFFLGILGFVIFVCLAYVFYYSKIFAGGDAKLLMAYGIILPYKSYSSLFLTSLVFIFFLFLIGAIYSLLYSLLIVSRNKQKFRKEFFRVYHRNKIILILATCAALVLLVFSFFNIILIPISLLLLTPILFAYTKSLEKCMLVVLSAKELTEGDWIESDIKISKRITIKKTVHGLTNEDIKILRKCKKKVLVKQGIPFVPAFLFALIIMALFFLISKSSPEALLSFLF